MMVMNICLCLWLGQFEMYFINGTYRPHLKATQVNESFAVGQIRFGALLCCQILAALANMNPQ